MKIIRKAWRFDRRCLVVLLAMTFSGCTAEERSASTVSGVSTVSTSRVPSDPNEFAKKDGFHVCNLSGGAAEVATARYIRDLPFNDQEVQVQGWTRLADGECRTMWPKLEARWYYVSAYDPDNPTMGWTSPFSQFCIPVRGTFNVRISARCQDPSKPTRGFIIVDVGGRQGKTVTLRPQYQPPRD